MWGLMITEFRCQIKLTETVPDQPRCQQSTQEDQIKRKNRSYNLTRVPSVASREYVFGPCTEQSYEKPCPPVKILFKTLHVYVLLQDLLRIASES